MADESPSPFVELTRDREGGLMIRFISSPDAAEFDAWGVDLARRCGGQIVERIDAPEGRVWQIEVGSQRLHFLYSPEHGTFLAAYCEEAEPVLRKIHASLENSVRRIAPKSAPDTANGDP